MAFDKDAFLADLEARGYKCRVKPKRTPEQMESALKVIKEYNEQRGIHGKSITKNTRNK